MEALAILEQNAVVTVMCPYCSRLHEHPAGTGRLNIPTPSGCSPDKFYTLSATMKERSLISALKGYTYDLKKKQRARAARKQPPVPATPGQAEMH